MNKIELIKKRRAELEEIKIILKTEFFGIDTIIDKIVSSIQTWYLLPEAVISPVIVNLWGLTGVGKTHLIRRLVQLLNYSDRFVEIQMDGTSGGSGIYQSSICSCLQSSTIEEGQLGIVLLDEFQRFRTIDSTGQDVKVERYQDVWMLLSDGRFASNYSIYSTLQEEMLQELYYEEHRKHTEESAKATAATKEEGKAAVTVGPILPEFKFKIHPWTVTRWKKTLKLKESAEEIMTWSASKITEICKQKLEERNFSEIDYSKLLVFICGNLDEAYKNAASALEDCDTDADVYHQITKRIGVTDIKGALMTRFKPEQISRLGNNHIVYPSLPKTAYYQIIQRECNRYFEKLLERTNITFTAEQSFFDEIYNNAVYPTQGTRPVLSTTHQILSGSLTDLAIWATEEHFDTISVSIDMDVSVLKGRYKLKSKSVPIRLDVRDLRKKNTLDFNTMVAVHEAGHAVLYAALFKWAPKEVKINLATFKGGFTVLDQQTQSKQDVLNNIAVLYGGTVAEEYVFGPDNRSRGCENDLFQAGHYAAKYVRLWGFDGFVGPIRGAGQIELVNNDVESTNQIIEDLLKKQKEHTFTVLKQYQGLFQEIVTLLLDSKTLKEQDFIDLAKKYIPDITIKVEDTNTTSAYHDEWQKFTNQWKPQQQQ